MITGKLVIKSNKKLGSLLKKAMVAWLEGAALWFERSAKILTTEENHIITGRYRASINLNSKDGSIRDTVANTKSKDGVHEVNQTEVSVKIGSNVEYAQDLEKKYSMLARSLDTSMPQMRVLFAHYLKKYLQNNS